MKQKVRDVIPEEDDPDSISAEASIEGDTEEEDSSSDNQRPLKRPNIAASAQAQHSCKKELTYRSLINTELTDSDDYTSSEWSDEAQFIFTPEQLSLEGCPYEIYGVIQNQVIFLPPTDRMPSLLSEGPVPSDDPSLPPGYVITMPCYADGDAKKLSDKSLNDLPNNAFAHDAETSRDLAKQRLRTVIGFNRPASPSKKRNRLLLKSMRTFTHSSPHIAHFGFYWLPKWRRKNSRKIVDLREVGAWYHQAKKKLTSQAVEEEKSAQYTANIVKELITKHDVTRVASKPGRKPTTIVPYRLCREQLRLHHYTRMYTRDLYKTGKVNGVYHVLFDDDYVNLRHPASEKTGLLSVYDQMIAEFWHKHHFFPHVLSTGYATSSTEKSIELLDIGVELDMAVRSATAKHISMAAYFPEPNSIIYVLPNHDTLEASYLKRGSASGGSEMPTLIKNLIRLRKINPQNTFVFDATRGPLITTMPDRFKVTPRGKNLSFAAQKTAEKKLLRWTKKDLIKLSRINQSHVRIRDWAKQVCGELPFFQRLQSNDSPILASRKSRILFGVMPNNQCYPFIENIVTESIGSGFTALETDRKNFSACLTSLKHTKKCRDFLAQEIFHAICSEDFTPPNIQQWRELYQHYKKAEFRRNRHGEKIIQHLPRYSITIPPHLTGSSPELLDFISKLEFPGSAFTHQMLRQNHSLTKSAFNQLLNFCKRKNIFDAYTRKFKEHLALRHHSAMLYAMTNNISLYIWEAKPGQIKHIKLKYRPKSTETDNQVMHLCFTSELNQYTRLIQGQPDYLGKRIASDPNTGLTSSTQLSENHIWSLLVSASSRLSKCFNPIWIARNQVDQAGKTDEFSFRKTLFNVLMQFNDHKIDDFILEANTKSSNVPLRSKLNQITSIPQIRGFLAQLTPNARAIIHAAYASGKAITEILITRLEPNIAIDFLWRNMMHDLGNDIENILPEKDTIQYSLIQALQEMSFEKLISSICRKHRIKIKNLVKQALPQQLTLLHYAALTGNTSAIKYLINNGCRTDATDKNGISPLHCALYYCNRYGVDESLLKLLIHIKIFQPHNNWKNSDSNPFILCLKYLNEPLAILQTLVKLGAKVNDAQDKNGISPVLLALQYDRYDYPLVKLLVNEANACPHTVDPFDDASPLIKLIEYQSYNHDNYQSKRLLAFLVSVSDIDSIYFDDESPLEYAIELENAYACELLVSAGADTEQLSPEQRRYIRRNTSHTHCYTLEEEEYKAEQVHRMRRRKIQDWCYDPPPDDASPYEKSMAKICAKMYADVLVEEADYDEDFRDIDSDELPRSSESSYDDASSSAASSDSSSSTSDMFRELGYAPYQDPLDEADDPQEDDYDTQEHYRHMELVTPDDSEQDSNESHSSENGDDSYSI